MKEQIDEIERDVKDIRDAIHRMELLQESRMTRIETSQKGFITISSLVFGAIITYLLNVFNLRG